MKFIQQNIIHVEIFMPWNDHYTTSKQTTFSQLYYINYHFHVSHIIAAITEATYFYFDYTYAQEAKWFTLHCSTLRSHLQWRTRWYSRVVTNTGIKIPVFTWQELKCMLAITDKITHGSNTVFLSNLAAEPISLLCSRYKSVHNKGISDKHVITTDAAN